MPLKGYDLFFTKPGEQESMRCRVCGDWCTVTRNACGPTGFAMALGKKSVLHDRFECSHTNEPWHEQALKLFCLIDDIPSPSLVELLRRDLAQVVEGRDPRSLLLRSAGTRSSGILH